MSARSCFLAQLVLLFVVTGSSMAQPAFRIVEPVGRAQFHPSDSIAISWEGNEGLPMRVEVVDDHGRRWRYSHGWKGNRIVLLPDALPTGRYRVRLVRIRPDSATIVIPEQPQKPMWGTPAISPDGRELAFASLNGKLQFWDMRSGALLRELPYNQPDTLPLGSDWFPRLKYSADGRRLLAAWEFNPGVNRIVDPASGALLWSDSSLALVDMGSDGDVIAVGNVVRRISDGSTIATVGDDTETPDRLILAPDLKHAVSFRRRAIFLWSLETGRRVHTWYPHYEQQVNDARFRPDGGAVVAVGMHNAVNAWDVVSGNYILEIETMAEAYGVSYSPDGLRLAAAFGNGTVGVYDARTGSLLHSIVTDRLNIRAEFSGDDERIVSFGNDYLLRIHTIETRLDTVVSDSSWEVLPPRLTLTVDGDFGPTIYPSDVDSAGVGELVNGETVVLPISSVAIEGPDSLAFRSGLSWPWTLVDSRTFGVAFRAQHFGPHEATLRIVLDTDTVRASLRGIGVRQPVQRRLSLVNVGKTRIGQIVDTLIPALISNVDSIAHAVSIVLVDGSAALGFDLLEGGGDFLLGPGESRDVKIRFQGKSFAQYGFTGRLRVFYDGIGSPFDVELFGYPMGTSSAPVESNGAAARILDRGETSTRLLLASGAHEVILVNALGESRRLASDIGPGEVLVEHGRLPSGLFMLVIRSEQGSLVLPLNGAW